MVATYNGNLDQIQQQHIYTRKGFTKTPTMAIPRRMCTRILSSNYADWIAHNKPKNANQRQARKLKSRLLKMFWSDNPVNGRVKTHDHASPSFILWKAFQNHWQTIKNQPAQ